MSPGDDLRRIVSSFVSGEAETCPFCDRFEVAFNLDTDKSALSEREFEAFNSLFNEVVYYSPFPEERAVIPIYRDEAQIRAAAEACLQKLDEGKSE